MKDTSSMKNGRNGRIEKENEDEVTDYCEIAD